MDGVQDVHFQNYYRIFDKTEDFCSHVAALLRAPAATGSHEARLTVDGTEKAAIEYAANFVHAALDALQTWKRASTPSDAQIGTSVQGTAGLIRQALECSAVGAWMVEDRAELGVRGYAALWKDMTEQANFPGMSFETNVPHHVDQRRQQMLSLGKLQGLLNASGTAPVVQIIGQRSACAAVILDPDVFGVSSAGPLYSWLSGMSHGLPWASHRHGVDVVADLVRTGDNGLEFTGEQLVIPRPDYLMLTPSLMAAHLAIRIACERIAVFRGLTLGEL